MNRSSRPGPEPTTLETVGNQWRYALVVVQAGDDDDDVIMTEVIARVHSVHLVNVEQRKAAADPQTEPPDLGCESAVTLRDTLLEI